MWSFMVLAEKLPYLCRNCTKWWPSWNGHHFEPLPIICHFGTILQWICHVKKTPDVRFLDFSRKTTLSLQKLYKMAAILKWMPFWATSHHFSFWHHSAMDLSCPKKPQMESFMILAEKLPYLCRNCTKWRPSWNGRHFEPLPVISRFGTMLQWICHVKKPQDMKFHDFGRKTTTPINYLNLDPDYQVRTRHDTLVSEGWNSITHSHQCRRLVKKRPSICYHVCVVNACKRSQAICRKSRTLCSFIRLLSVHTQPICAEQER